jgi:putative effector of murein hydrolase
MLGGLATLPVCQFAGEAMAFGLDRASTLAPKSVTAGIAIGLNGLLTALLVPVVVRWLVG